MHFSPDIHILYFSGGMIMVTRSLPEIWDAFDHLIELLQDEGAHTEVISMVENAKEAMEDLLLEAAAYDSE